MFQHVTTLLTIIEPMKKSPSKKKKLRNTRVTAVTPSTKVNSNSRYRTTSLNLDKRILVLAKKNVAESQGKFRSMSALFNFEFSRIFGIK